MRSSIQPRMMASGIETTKTARLCVPIFRKTLDLQAFLDGNANRDPEGAEVAPKDVASGDDEATTEDP
ncbi:MAG: hypothetical protein AAGH19_10850 [Pseudomonadota bacterium]